MGDESDSSCDESNTGVCMHAYTTRGSLFHVVSAAEYSNNIIVDGPERGEATLTGELFSDSAAVRSFSVLQVRALPVSASKGFWGSSERR